jgi:ABC-type transporter Mla MlaB component
MSSPAPARQASGDGIALVEDGPVRFLRFSGDIGRDVVRQFRRAVRPAQWPARIDLSEVRTLDPAGRELLLHLARRQKRIGSELEVVPPPPPLRLLMEQSGLTSVSHWATPDAPPPAPGLGTASSA